MNVIRLLKNKDSVAYIYENSTIRQGLEKMRAHGYTAIPVITASGEYAGSISEGDFLWHILAVSDSSMKSQEKYLVKDIIRKDFIPAVRVDVPMQTLLERSMTQNFIPVTDDRGSFIGIVTRRDIIGWFIDREKNAE